MVCKSVPPVDAVYHRNVPATPYDAEMVVVPVAQIVLLVTVGAVIAAVTVAVTADLVLVHVPSLNST